MVREAMLRMTVVLSAPPRPNWERRAIQHPSHSKTHWTWARTSKSWFKYALKFLMLSNAHFSLVVLPHIQHEKLPFSFDHWAYPTSRSFIRRKCAPRLIGSCIPEPVAQIDGFSTSLPLVSFVTKIAPNHKLLIPSHHPQSWLPTIMCWCQGLSSH